LAKFPEPPPAAILAKTAPEILRVPAGTTLWRLYFRGGRHPTFWNTFRSFGPIGSRFDHQLPPPRLQERTILYCASEGPTCLAEVFQETRVIDRSARDPWLAAFKLIQPLTLLDLTGSWPTRAGASMAISTGPRPRAQRWAQAIYEAYRDVQGIHYPSSMHANRPAVALWERGAEALPPMPVFHRPLLDPALLPVLSRVAHDIGYGLV
jgi:RES domain-containing protein